MVEHFAAEFFRVFPFFFSRDYTVEPEVRDLWTPNWNQSELLIPDTDQKDEALGTRMH